MVALLASDGARATDPPGSTATHCAHCGLDLTATQRRDGKRFCCSGCEFVHDLIHAEGLDRYYDLKPTTTAPPTPSAAESHAWLEAAITRSPDGGRARATLDVQGVHCAACVWLLDTLYRRHDGALSLRINPARGTAEASWNADTFDLAIFLREAARFGYRFGPSTRERTGSDRALLIRMGISVAAALNVMVFMLTFHLGLTADSGMLHHVIGAVAFALTAVTIVAGGTPILRTAIASLRHRALHLDLPIALGIALAFTGSTVVYLQDGPGATYFDTVAIFVALMIVGRWLQEHVLARNRRLILEESGVDHLMTRRAPRASDAEPAGDLQTIPVESVALGDTLVIVPGDLVPVAGRTGRPAVVSLDWITGESEPIAFAAGARLPAGAFNADRTPITLIAEEPFAASRLADLLVPIEDAPADGGPDTGTPASAARRDPWWHRVSAWYVASVLSVAALTAVAWAFADPARVVPVTVAVLVVSCPCAIGLAIPMARELTSLGLRRVGVYVRRFGFFDRAVAIRNVVFDKTGTMTGTSMTLTPASRRALDALGAPGRAALVALASRSNHPVSLAIAHAAGSGGLAADPEVPPMDDLRVEEIEGEGVRWVTNAGTYRLGRVGTSMSSGGARVRFSCDERTIASFDLDEELRTDAVDEVALLQASGYETYLFSGDAASRTEEIARSLGIPAANVAGTLAPEDKAHRVGDLGRDHTMMVGDGINDALGFGAASVTMAPLSTHAAMPARADAYFVGHGISAVRRSLVAARQLRRTIALLLALAVTYNLVAVSLACLGRVTPVGAAILMPLSSVTVVSVAVWLLTGKRRRWTF